jgi:hypothetical protein
MRRLEQLTADYRRLIEGRDDLLSRVQEGPTPAELGQAEAIAGSLLSLLEEPVARHRSES